jgi:hypothetical protein
VVSLEESVSYFGFKNILSFTWIAYFMPFALGGNYERKLVCNMLHCVVLGMLRPCSFEGTLLNSERCLIFQTLLP